MTQPEHDPVNHPTHYQSDATCDSCGVGIECIEVVRHLPFTRGNAIKYLWRAGAKGSTVEDLKKAIWYIEDEIAQLEGRSNPNVHKLAVEDDNNQYLEAIDDAFHRQDPARWEKANIDESTRIGRVTNISDTENGIKIDVVLDGKTDSKDEANELVKLCLMSDKSFWSSDGYTYRCKIHECNVTVPHEVKPKSCYEY